MTENSLAGSKPGRMLIRPPRETPSAPGGKSS